MENIFLLEELGSEKKKIDKIIGFERIYLIFTWEFLLGRIFQMSILSPFN